METKKNKNEVTKIMNEYHNNESSLIQVLLDIQAQNHWLQEEDIISVSRELGVPLGRVYHVATFYKAFSLVRKGKHVARVCMGTACHVRKAPSLLGEMQRRLDVRVGQTTKDGRFSLETVNCMGCCALGPVLAIDDRYYGNPSSSELDGILADYE